MNPRIVTPLLFGLMLAILVACADNANPPPGTIAVTPVVTIQSAPDDSNNPSDNAAQTPDDSAGLVLPDGYRAQVVVTGLQGPTQMTLGPDGDLYIGQLAGGENAGQGQILAVSLATGESRVVLEGLSKPTGITFLGNDLWIAAGRDLLRAPITADSPLTLGDPETILRDLPTNGRSNGQLMVLTSGELLYETSGFRAGNERGPNSGALWALNPANPTAPREVAIGFKNAYAHAYDNEGTLWTTDVADDRVNDQPPPDELNVVLEGADYGWPQCFGEQEAATNYGGTAERCQQTRPSVVTFPPGATPVGLVPSPFEENTMLVATWGGPEPAVYAVRYTRTDDNATGTVDLFLDGLARPQSLLVLEDGSLLVSDFEVGKVYRVVQTGE